MGRRESGDVDKNGRPSPALGQPRSVPGRRAWWLLAVVGCAALAMCSWWWIRQPALDPVEAANTEIAAFRKESFDIAQALVAADPNKKLYGLELLAIEYNLWGDTDKALSCWQQALELDPNRPDLYGAMASIALNKKGEYEKAVEICRTGLAKSDGSPGLYCYLAESLIGAGRPNEAVGELQRAIEMSPQNVEAFFLLGKAYSLLNEPEKAKGSHETALKLQPNHGSAYYGLAMACAQMGLADESKRALEQYRKLRETVMTGIQGMKSVAFDVATCRSMLANTCAEAANIYYLKFHDPDKAEKLLRRGAGVDSGNVPCRAQLAALLMKRNRAEDAVPICKEMIAIEPKNPANYLALAVCYARLGRNDDARAMACQCLKRDPQNVECGRLLQRLLEGSGIR